VVCPWDIPTNRGRLGAVSRSTASFCQAVASPASGLLPAIGPGRRRSPLAGDPTDENNSTADASEGLAQEKDYKPLSFLTMKWEYIRVCSILVGWPPAPAPKRWLSTGRPVPAYPARTASAGPVTDRETVGFARGAVPCRFDPDPDPDPDPDREGAAFELCCASRATSASGCMVAWRLHDRPASVVLTRNPLLMQLLVHDEQDWT